MVARLEGNARRRASAGFEGWTKDAGRGAAQAFRFAGFNQAFAFVTEIALKAERMSRYNRMSVPLSTQERPSTHGAGSIRLIGTLAT